MAVTDNVNQAKSDSGPEEWLPPLGMSLMFKTREWVGVNYPLTVYRLVPLHVRQDVDSCQAHVWSDRDLGREECAGGLVGDLLGLGR